MSAFTLAVFLLLITPGPGVLSAAGVGAAFGFRPGFRYIIGLLVGSNMVTVAVISGMAAALELYPVLRTVLLAVSVAYLLYLAAKIALAGSRIAFIHAERPPGIAGGIVLQVFNPKAYVVNTALFTGFPFLAGDVLRETAIKVVIFNGIWIPIHFAWLGAGIWLNRLDLSARTHRIINVGMALAMLAVVGLAALSR